MKAHLQPQYENEIRQFRSDFSTAGAYTAIILILLGVGLDYGLYPHMQYLFGAVRVIVSLVIFGIILFLKTEEGKNRVEILSFVWLILPQIMITWMIAETEGATSLYSIGLYLAIFASSIALPFSFRLNLFLCLTTFTLYIAACSFHPESFVLRGAFVVNSLILSFVITVSLLSAYFNERARLTLFRLRAEVAEKNTELEQTNRDLAQIKGQLLQQEKMAAIGTLAAGLLHEVNNPVNYSLMAISIAQENPAARADAQIKECLADAREGMQRIQHIVSDLKTFAYRPREAEAGGNAFPLARAIDSAMRLVGHEIKEIAITRELPEDTLVFGDEAAIVGVLVNLMGNSAAALHHAARENPSIRISGLWEEGRLHVTLEDNGSGIAPENLARVFEPFFTTREIGQGLGLGLSISYGVIERHGGTLRAESEPGKGTRMIFDLPSAAQ
jgi:two-component system sensor histidine kinase PhcS